MGKKDGEAKKTFCDAKKNFRTEFLEREEVRIKASF